MMQQEISAGGVMPDGNRVFVEAITKYCTGHGIACEVKSQGWLIVMERDGVRRFALGYDLGLNSAISHRIASDKAAASDILAMAGIPCIAPCIYSSHIGSAARAPVSFFPSDTRRSSFPTQTPVVSCGVKPMSCWLKAPAVLLK